MCQMIAHVTWQLVFKAQYVISSHWGLTHPSVWVAGLWNWLHQQILKTQHVCSSLIQRQLSQPQWLSCIYSMSCFFSPLLQPWFRKVGKTNWNLKTVYWQLFTKCSQWPRIGDWSLPSECENVPAVDLMIWLWTAAKHEAKDWLLYLICLAGVHQPWPWFDIPFLKEKMLWHEFSFSAGLQAHSQITRKMIHNITLLCEIHSPPMKL